MSAIYFSCIYPFPHYLGLGTQSIFSAQYKQRATFDERAIQKAAQLLKARNTDSPLNFIHLLHLITLYKILISPSVNSCKKASGLGYESYDRLANGQVPATRWYYPGWRFQFEKFYFFLFALYKGLTTLLARDVAEAYVHRELGTSGTSGTGWFETPIISRHMQASTSKIYRGCTSPTWVSTNSAAFAR